MSYLTPGGAILYLIPKSFRRLNSLLLRAAAKCDQSWSRDLVSNVWLSFVASQLACSRKKVIHILLQGKILSKLILTPSIVEQLP